MSTETINQENLATNNTEAISALTEPDKLMVQGVAIHSGVSRNGIMYTAEELGKFAKTMEGVSIIKDHNAIVDNVIGVVERTKSLQDGNVVRYEGWIKDRSVAEKIKDRMVRNVSIGALATMVKESEKSEHLIATNIQGVELSVVVVPGVPGATIQQSLTAHENAKTTEEKLKIKPISEDVSKFISLEEWKRFEDLKQKIVPQANEEKCVSNNEKVANESIKMEEPKMENDSKVSEMQASLTEKESLLKAQLEELAKLKAANAKLAEEKRQVLVESYKKLCKEKSVEEQNVAEMSEDVIKALVTQLEKTKVAIAQESKLRGQVGEPAQEMKMDDALRYERSSFGKGYSIFREAYDPAKHKRLAR